VEAIHVESLRWRHRLVRFALVLMGGVILIGMAVPPFASGLAGVLESLAFELRARAA